MVVALFGCSATKETVNIDIPATYEQVGLALDVKYKLNDNNTFDEENSGAKGTFSITDDGFSLKHKTNRILNPLINYSYSKNGDLYCLTGDSFKNDIDYGAPLSLDSNNRTNQGFKSAIYYNDDENDKLMWTIQFELDGSVVCRQFGVSYTSNNGVQMLAPNERLQVKEGKYSISDNIITISYDDGSENKLVIINNCICWNVLQKI